MFVTFDVSHFDRSALKAVALENMSLSTTREGARDTHRDHSVSRLHRMKPGRTLATAAGRARNRARNTPPRELAARFGIVGGEEEEEARLKN